MNENYNALKNPNYLEQLMKPSEVATLLNVSRSFCYSLLQSGQIPAVRLGRSVRVRPKDLEEYIQANIHGGDNGL